MSHVDQVEPQARGLALKGLTKQFGASTAVRRLDLEVTAGEFVTLLGPSGCGKTTTIRMVAGYVAPTRGQILLGGRDVTALPPQRRRMGMVFQDYALFPHLTVRDNVAFGLRMRKVGKRERHVVADEKLELVGLRDAAEKVPAELSGGMRQRVALARALAIGPEVLLLDEPFSALDAKLRTSLRAEVKRLQQITGVTTLLVTHDQQEALGVSDRIVVMRDGAVEQVGAPEQIYERPQTPFVLDFVGRASAVEGAVVGPHARSGWIACDVAGTTVVAEDPGGLARGARVTLAVRPENVEIVARVPEGEPNAFDGTVVLREYAGGVEQVDVAVPALGRDVHCETAARSRADSVHVEQGDRVTIRFRPDDVIVLADGAGAGLSEQPDAALASGAAR